MVTKICLDTSIIIDGKISELIEKGKLKDVEIIVPIAVLDELQAQASKGREPGFIGLDELKKLRKICEKRKIKIRFTGERPSFEDIRLAKSGRLDALIRDVAKSEKGVLYTADYVQALVAEAEGVKVEYVTPEIKTTGLVFEKFFTPDTLSVHLKEDVPPLAKRGKPGKFKLVKVGKEPLTKEEIEGIIREISEATRISEEAFVEISRSGALVLQLGNYRIAIARPPFSDGLEVTIVRPIVKLRLEDYKLSDRLIKRLMERAEGILLAGPPGSGKCLPKHIPILLSNGRFITSGELFKTNYSHSLISLNSQSTEKSKITKKYRKFTKNIVRIKTLTGREIELTEDHPILTIEGSTVKWVPANKLGRGSFVGVPRRIGVETVSERKINWIDKVDGKTTFAILKDGSEISLEELKKNKINEEEISKIYYMGGNFIKSLPIKPPGKISNELCEILGYMWSEGTGEEFEFNNSNPKLVKRFKKLMNKVFGIEENLFYTPAKGRYRIRKSETLLKFFERVFGYPKRKKSLTLDLPPLLLGASNEEISHFMRAYFDGNGSVDERGVEISTRSKKMSEKILYLLLRLNILCSRKEKKVKNGVYYRIVVGDKENVARFYRKVGTLIHREKFKPFLSKSLHWNLDLIPAGNLLAELYKCLNLNRDVYGLKKNRFSRRRLNRHFQILFNRLLSFQKLRREVDVIEKHLEILKGWKDVLRECKKCIKFDHDNSFFRKYNLDHRCINLWVRGERKPKLYTLVKLLKAVKEEYGKMKEELDEWTSLKENWHKNFVEVYRKVCKDSSELDLNVSRGLVLQILKRESNLKLKSLEDMLRAIQTLYFEKISKAEDLFLNLIVLSNESIFWDRVKEIKRKSYRDYSFDFEIEKLHNFAAGYTPFFVHNSTFASSLADFYSRKKKVVIKTLESPRDMQVSKEVTQYRPLEGSFEKAAEILLLVRPDYVIFDEIKKTKDFQIFSDMRLSGIGMIGTVHATDPIDAVQRFITRVELGMIPHIIDTILYVKGGEVKRVYKLSMTVKVPTGMVEADLARPVVEVRDFETDKLEYEIYTYGEENIIIPVGKAGKPSGVRKLAKERILQEIKKFDKAAEVEIVSENQAIVRVDNKVIPRLIGKNGMMISSIQEKLGIHIEVEPRIPAIGREVTFKIKESGNSIEFLFTKRMTGKIASIYIEDEFLFSATVGKKGKIRVTKSSDVGKEIIKALIGNKTIRVLI